MGMPAARSMRNRGFTLIELMVVMAVIGLLLSLSVPRYFHQVDRAKESVLKQNLAIMRDAIDKYYSDNGVYPDSLIDMVGKHYLKALPLDPVTERNDTWITVAPEKKEMGNVLNVKSGAKGRASDGSDYLAW